MGMNSEYYKIYASLRSLRPKPSTDRKSDLNHILGLCGSFCIFSEYRNGTTTLMRDFAKQVNGIWVDAMGLSEQNAIFDLEQKIGSGNNPLLLDETALLFRKLSDFSVAMDYLQNLSKKRQVGLRIHPEEFKYEKDFIARNFEIFKMGKVKYSEFKSSVDKEFEGIDFVLPVRFIEYAHENYSQFAKSMSYVAHAFSLVLEYGDDDVSDLLVRKEVESMLTF